MTTERKLLILLAERCIAIDAKFTALNRMAIARLQLLEEIQRARGQLDHADPADADAVRAEIAAFERKHSTDMLALQTIALDLTAKQESGDEVLEAILAELQREDDLHPQRDGQDGAKPKAHEGWLARLVRPFRNKQVS